MQSNESIDHAIDRVIKLQIIFIVMSVLLLVLVFIFLESINLFVWLRSGELTILSFVFLRFGLKLKEKNDQPIYMQVL